MALPLVATGARMAMQALPLLTGAASALPALQQGNILEAALQGGLGYLTGGAVKSGLGGLQNLAQANIGKAGVGAALGAAQTGVGQALGLGAQKAAAPFLTKGALRTAAQIGIPLAGIAAVPTLAGVARGTSAGVSNVLGGATQLGLGLAGERPYTPGYQTPGAPYAQIDQFGNITPYGSSITDVYGVPGMTRSAETIRQAEASAEGLKRLGDVQFQIAEAAEKQNFARQMAAQGIKQNIATQAAMIQGAQNAAKEMGLEASRGVTQALANRMQYQ